MSNFSRSCLLAVALLPIPVLFNGCAKLDQQGPKSHDTDKPIADIYNYAVVADKSGLPTKPEMVKGRAVLNGPTMDTSTPEGKAMSASYFRSMMDNLDSKAPSRGGKKQILIFIHGGMNNKKSAVERSARLTPRILKKDSESYYPIFIDWNSGPVSSYGEHLLVSRRGGIHPIEGALSSPLYLLMDVARGIGRAPEVWMNQIIGAFQMPRRKSSRGFAANEFRQTLSAHELLKSESRTSVGAINVSERNLVESDERNNYLVGRNFVHTLFFAPKAATSVIIDIVGTNAWDMMLRRAHLLFSSPASKSSLTSAQQKSLNRLVEITRSEKPQEHLVEIDRIAKSLKGAGYPSNSKQGAATQFLEALSKHIQSSKHSYSITLIGHSMGTIVANEMLERYPSLPIDNIVYLAAACSVKEAQESVGGYLKLKSHVNFYNVCLHPIADKSETAFSIDPISKTPETGGARQNVKQNTASDYLLYPLGYAVPQGSLLEWLDGFFTKPVTLEQRRYGKWSNSVIATNSFPEKVRGQVYMKVFPVADFTVPQKHGAFGSENLEVMFWKKRFWKP